MGTLAARLRSRVLRPTGEGSTATRGSLRVSRELLLLRWVLVAGQAATILVSWPVWQARDAVPELPVLAVPSVDMGIPLLLSLGVLLRYPVAGTILHALTLLVSFGMDQTRLQPEVVSMTILLAGTFGTPWLQLIARAHLMTLWFWAGLSKLMSPEFFSGVAPWMLDGLPFLPSFSGLSMAFGWAVVALEMGAGVLAVPVRTRRVSVACAIAVHFGALVALGPLGHGWNAVIWPWNVVLPVAAVVLIGGCRRSLRDELAGVGRLARGTVAFIVLYPAAYYAGAADAYLSHHLYSADTPSAVTCEADGECARFLTTETLDTLRVPLPPEHRIFRAYFDGTCRPGEVLRIADPRRRYAGGGWEDVRSCPAS